MMEVGVPSRAGMNKDGKAGLARGDSLTWWTDDEG